MKTTLRNSVLKNKGEKKKIKLLFFLDITGSAVGKPGSGVENVQECGGELKAHYRRKRAPVGQAGSKHWYGVSRKGCHPADLCPCLPHSEDGQGTEGCRVFSGVSEHDNRGLRPHLLMNLCCPLPTELWKTTRCGLGRGQRWGVWLPPGVTAECFLLCLFLHPFLQTRLLSV